MPSEANISNFENWELSEVDNYQEQNYFNSNIQTPIDVQNNFPLGNEIDNSDDDTTREDTLNMSKEKMNL